jgi:multisubunit Na+/H+ antiporter MnhE subunit
LLPSDAGKRGIVSRPRILADLVPWLVAWGSLFLLWLLLVDALEMDELAIGAAAAAVGATAFEVVHRQRTVRFRAEWRWLLAAWRLPVRALSDYPAVMATLWRRVVLRRRVRGAFVRLPLDPGGTGGRAVARRALLIAAGSFAPNTFVVDLTRGGSSALVHRLVPRAGSDRVVPGA